MILNRGKNARQLFPTLVFASSGMFLTCCSNLLLEKVYWEMECKQVSLGLQNFKKRYFFISVIVLIVAFENLS